MCEERKEGREETGGRVTENEEKEDNNRRKGVISFPKYEKVNKRKRSSQRMEEGRKKDESRKRWVI